MTAFEEPIVLLCLTVPHVLGRLTSAIPVQIDVCHRPQQRQWTLLRAREGWIASITATVRPSRPNIQGLLPTILSTIFQQDHSLSHEQVDLPLSSNLFAGTVANYYNLQLCQSRDFLPLWLLATPIGREVPYHVGSICLDDQDLCKATCERHVAMHCYARNWKFTQRYSTD